MDRPARTRRSTPLDYSESTLDQVVPANPALFLLAGDVLGGLSNMGRQSPEVPALVRVLAREPHFQNLNTPEITMHTTTPLDLDTNASVFAHMADNGFIISTQGDFCLRMREAARQLHATGRLTDSQLAQLLG